MVGILLGGFVKQKVALNLVVDLIMLTDVNKKNHFENIFSPILALFCSS